MLNSVPNPRITLEDIRAGTRFFFRVARLLRGRVTAEEAHTVLRERLKNRNANFLAMVRHAIYGNPASPYRRLLELAGCEYGDMERLVQHEGLEGTLRALYRKGVYLTVEESKGRRPVVRGSATFEFPPRQLHDPRVVADMVATSSGSRGRGTVPIDLTAMRDQAVDFFLDLEARGGLDWVFARCGVPGSAILGSIIRYCLCGVPPTRWFLMVDPSAPGLRARYEWSCRVLHWAGLLAGARLPRPVYVTPSDPLSIAQWMADVLRNGHTPHVFVYASGAVRICRAAREAGLKLNGAQFMLGGEPTTAARLSAIHRAGAEAEVSYNSTETGIIGAGCLAPNAPDDVHLIHDRVGLIQPGGHGQAGEDGAVLPSRALLFTSLLPRARLILLNASLGDQAEVVERRCGCPLEQLGWTTHLHTIRSFEKLTAGGMTFLDLDVVRVLEEVLPRRFGGEPTDYQLVDEEAADGQPCLRLLVHPRLGPLDGEAIRETFLAAIGPGSGVERLMAYLWRDARFMVVERQVPRATDSGKIQHVHLQRRT